jgi:hypothetical protein
MRAVWLLFVAVTPVPRTLPVTVALALGNIVRNCVAAAVDVIGTTI